MSEKPSFESSCERLEKILERMNSETVSLDESIKLFEEADQLISHCSKILTTAEQKIEKLIKNRDNQLLLDENKKPQTEAFSSMTIENSSTLA